MDSDRVSEMNKVIRGITLYRCTQLLSWDVSCLIARDIFSVKLHDVRNNAWDYLMDNSPKFFLIISSWASNKALVLMFFIFNL